MKISNESKMIYKIVDELIYKLYKLAKKDLEKSTNYEQFCFMLHEVSDVDEMVISFTLGKGWDIDSVKNIARQDIVDAMNQSIKIRSMN